MKPQPAKWIEKFRDTTHPVFQSNRADRNNGVFRVPFPASGVVLLVLASDGKGWDHVSVSLPDRCPTWLEMTYIKDAFFRGDEAVVQFHPPKSEYVNDHPFCLHLWRPQEDTIPLPPSEMVGPKPKDPKPKEPHEPSAPDTSANDHHSGRGADPRAAVAYP